MKSHAASSCLILVSLLMASQRASAADSVYPGATWSHKEPAEVGLNASKLKAFSDFVGGRGCIVRHGCLVYSWGDVDQRADVASAAKPFYAHFLWKAIEDGKIEGVKEKVVKWEPRLGEINEALGFPDRDIRWRDLANQTSCYQLVERPGTAYAYNDWQMALFWDTLFLKVYNTTYDNIDRDVFHPLLTDVLQCQDNPTMMAFGTRNRPGRVAISVRDFARFGLLYLRGGDWNGRQLIRPEHARTAVSSPVPNSIPRAGNAAAEMIPGQRSIGSERTPDNQTDHFGSYSWLWWLNGVDRNGTRMFPDAPHDLYGAFGHGGPRAMWVIPSLDLVVSYNDAKMRQWVSGTENPTNTAMKRLMDAVAVKSSSLDHRPVESEDVARFAKWQRIELTFRGPNTPGRETQLDAVFSSPAGKEYLVPGFYDGDGKGGPDGTVWKVRFSADEPGRWTYTTRSSHELLRGQTGRLLIAEVAADAEGCWKWGRLEAVGTSANRIRYLKFRDGPYWLKAGCDDPENFLGSYAHFDTVAKRQAAVDYLAGKGINSLYIMTHNLRGDDRDVWPWFGASEDEAMANGGSDARFDLARLEQWRVLFEYMQARGVVPYLVLEDDSAWTGYDHDRYWREMIARFAYLPAVVFNLGEEHNENYRLGEGLAMAERFKILDPFNHPLAIHNVNRPTDAYIDSTAIDLTSIQTGSPGSRRGLDDAIQHNQIAIDWIERCRARKRRALVVNFDEGRPELDRRAWWSAYLGGGVWEAHVLEPYDRPHSAWDRVWTELGGTRRFMESLPFSEMEPHNEFVKQGRAFCLAKPGSVYAVYLPVGGAVRVELAEGNRYRYAWWNPANGVDGTFEPAQRTGGGVQAFTAPRSGDWALRIVRARDSDE